MTARPRLASFAAVIAATLLLLAAILAVGRPSVFTDTDDYYSLGQEIADGAATLLAGRPTAADAGWRPAPEDAARDAHMARSQMAARSVAYALAVYPVHQLGTLWLLAAIQSALAAWLIWLLWGVAVPGGSRRGYLGVMAALAVASSLPLFTGFAMPDIFAPLAVIMAALLLTSADRLGRGTRTAVALLLGYAYAVHTTHVLVGVVLLGTAWPLLRWQGVARPVAAARMAVVGLALMLGVLVNSGYGAWVQYSTGDPLRRPPFLVARVLADGPGRDYLRAACAHATPYTLCRFKHAPLDNSDEILWDDPPNGIFNVSSYQTRMALEDEEARFVIGTLRYDFIGEVRAALGNWWRQALRIEVDDPVRDPVYYLTDSYWKDTNLPELIESMGGCGRDGRQCAPRLTAHVSRIWHGGIVIAAALAVAAALARRRGTSATGDRRLPAIAGFIIVAVIVNAAVCGILSGPFARYQSRLIWLVPLLALLLLADWWTRRRVRAFENHGV
ncbi:hypothetical protein KX816_00725 [Sphingosinicellaceae bacterium]|nr:hypothetical protein KX816_00725 [Sphingosinicellaceae bacterium]